ncbi:mitochondrial glutathione transporter SLC25A40-like [Lycorma delicatula]|uniref:mitochondrial glutathione transporter SLC25A40-like n=1 Tax=Lycorma delicatula TaxID=130591 RepID=UPI003F5192CE
MDTRVTNMIEKGVDDPDFRITPYQQMAAACTGALLTSLIVTPLDVVKIRLQAQQKMLTSNKCFLYCNGLMDHICPCVDGTSSNYWYRRPSHFNGTLDAFIKITRNEGLQSLWSGLSPTLVLALPATVVYFVTYEQLRTRLKDRFVSQSTKTGNVTQPFWIPLVSGCMARLWAATTVSPLELIRTKMQSKRLSYFETHQVLQGLLQTHGWKGLWKGLAPTLLRDVPFSGIYWVSYEQLKSMRNTKVTFMFSFIAGSISGAIAAIVTTPFDVVKTFRQIELADEIITDTAIEKKSTLAVMRQIYNQSGIQGLFTGLIPRIVKVAPACAIMVATFEYGKSFFEKYNYTEYQKRICLKKKEIPELNKLSATNLKNKVAE